jgi:hypothetical protein
VDGAKVSDFSLVVKGMAEYVYELAGLVAGLYRLFIADQSVVEVGLSADNRRTDCQIKS